MTETFHKETVWADTIVDFQNFIGLQLYRKQLRQRVSLGLLCKFHRRVREVALIPHRIAAGIRKERNPVGRKYTFALFDFRGTKVINPQCGRHTPLRTPFRYIYLGVIRAKDDDLFAASTVFCVRFHAPTVNYFRFRPGVELAIRAVITFEFTYFFSYIVNFTSYSVKRSRGSKMPPRLLSNHSVNIQPFTHTRPAFVGAG